MQLVLQLTDRPASEHIEFVDTGWTSRVYLIDSGRIVFKFPRTPEVKQEYARERAILEQLANADLPVQIPVVHWNSPSFDYVGYLGVVGTPLDEIVDELGADARFRIGKEIGEFLGHLHCQTIDTAQEQTLEDEIAEMEHKYQLARPVIERDFTASEQDRIRALMLVIAPATITRLGTEIRLSHGDLGFWNIILSDSGIPGVIDFGDVGYYDQSRDFVGLSDPTVLAGALSVYGESELLRQKIAIRQRVLPVLELPFHIGKRDETEIARTVERIRSMF